MPDLDLSGRVAIVTGAGSGLGRAEAFALASAGASVVVNDVVPPDDVPPGAVFVPGDVSSSDVSRSLISTAESLGGLDIVVNNAGVVRDRMLFTMSDEEWDLVVRVHLRGHFLLCRDAGSLWRSNSKAAGAPVYGRLINTTSEAWFLGAVAQPNYAAAKAGIVSLTVAAARGLARYGVRANAICPRARTAMTSPVYGPAPTSGVDPLDVSHITPLVVYLAAPASSSVNGQVFFVHGGMVAVLAPPSVEAQFDAAGASWADGELAESLGEYFASHGPDDVFTGRAISAVQRRAEPAADRGASPVTGG
ncbi:SDR family NAD(P)-dependent oxidoreductase [Cryptosporangium phraense]|uniref:SDR family oxidoreductase n=1 Tax=Cryptosporangium phraense TaxID=2593070 RepID=A0A545B0F7_9ACTN|nr:SDR family NAD(P)-dependent oxidoreductase [Cryptosporangium phraense]TQS47061.1 SDR family oxidoreductase [Cryptosporangium phraense]